MTLNPIVLGVTGYSVSILCIVAITSLMWRDTVRYWKRRALAAEQRLDRRKPTNRSTAMLPRVDAPPTVVSRRIPPATDPSPTEIQPLPGLYPYVRYLNPVPAPTQELSRQ